MTPGAHLRNARRAARVALPAALSLFCSTTTGIVPQDPPDEHAAHHPQEQEASVKTADEGMGGMMWAMGLVWLLVVLVLVLAAAALVKYLFFDSGRRNRDD